MTENSPGFVLTGWQPEAAEDHTGFHPPGLCQENHARARRTPAAHPERIEEILQQGTLRAQQMARATLHEVMQKMGLSMGLQFGGELSRFAVALQAPFC